MNVKELLESRAAKLKQAREIMNKTTAENRKPTAAEREEFDKLLDESRELELQVSEFGLDKSIGRVGHLQSPDDSIQIAKPGEFRLLRNTEKVSQVYPLTSQRDVEERKMSLGKFLGLAAGQSPPDSELERRALSSYLDASGSVTVPVAIAQNIMDMARNQSVCLRAGAQTLVMRSAKEMIPKLTQDVTGAWKVEGREAGESSAAFGGIELQARTLFFWLPISQELWSDAIGLDAALEKSISENCALLLDAAALTGSGAGENPQGLYYNGDVVKTAVNVDAYEDISDSIYRIENANHEATAVVMSPRTKNYCRKIQDLNENFKPIPIWMPEIYVTKQLPDNLGGGTNESIVVVGDFSNLIFGIRMDLTIQILKEIKAQSYQVVLMGALRADVAAVRPAAFDITTGVLSTWIGGE